MVEFSQKSTITVTPPIYLQAKYTSTRSALRECLKYFWVPDEINQATNDAPCIIHGQVNLCTELGRFELLSSQDDVPSRILHIITCYVTVR